MRILLVDFNPFMPPATPISLGYLGAVLKVNGHDVKVLSLGSTSVFSPDIFKGWVREYSPDLVGMAIYQRNIFHINSLALLAKTACPKVKVVVGGPQATFIPEKALESLGAVDFICRGEGERVIVEIVEAMQSGEMEYPVAGTTSRMPDGEYVTGMPVKEVEDLDDYPSPWFEGILDPADMEEAIMLTSRGCPYGCSFCYTPAAFGRRVRANSVERVLEEISFVAGRGSGRMWFADPNFSFSEKRVAEILEGIVGRNLKVDMWIETRADMLDRGLIELMKGAGVSMVAMGLESASENVYPSLKKNLNPERIRHAVEMVFNAGMDVELFSQYALPNERFEDSLQTLEFVKSSGVRIQGNSNAQQMQIYFGSEIAERPDQYGVIPLRESFDPCLAIGTEFETEWMSREEINRIKTLWKSESLDGGKRVVS